MEDASAAVPVVRSYPFGPIVGFEIDPMYFWLQEHEPLSRVKLPYGDEGWLLVRYDDCRAALADARSSLAEAAARDVPRLTRVVATDEGDRLTEDELIQLTLLLLAAGYETTASQITNFTYALATHPDQLALLRARYELMSNAVEELMRWVPLLATAAALPRYALKGVGLSSGTVPAGDPILVAKHAANRDPRRFDDPDHLDITRDASAHLGFGHGAHHCIGAPLARMDLQVALAALLDRFPDLHLPFPKTNCNGRPAWPSAARSPCRSAGEGPRWTSAGRSPSTATPERRDPRHSRCWALGDRTADSIRCGAMWQASELEQRINKIMDRATAAGDDHGKRARVGLAQAKQDA
jgi:cytochrome P450